MSAAGTGLLAGLWWRGTAEFDLDRRLRRLALAALPLLGGAVLLVGLGLVATRL